LQIEEGNSSIRDTFLSTKAWARGMVWVNGHNLGRYWTAAGPQQTLYVPKWFLKSGSNEVVVLELEKAPDCRLVKFLSEPDFSGYVDS
jgi:beta-galactosidase